MSKIELSWPTKPEKDLSSFVPRSSVSRWGPLPLEHHGEGPLTGRVIKGDNLVAMEHLLESEERLDLVYIDPPFATGMNYYSSRTVSGVTVNQKAYSDTAGMEDYLNQMLPRLQRIHSLLKPTGKLFLHCDWRANSMLRVLLDEVFGASCFRNEIIWRRSPNLGRQAASGQLGRVIDTILVYSKTPKDPFRGEMPKRRREVEYTKKGTPKGAKWDPDRKLFFTTAPRGDYTDKSIAALREKGRIYDSATGKVYVKYFLTPGDNNRWFKEQPVDTIWDDFAVRPLRHCPKTEDMGYDTQKPEGLLERIIEWATKPGDLVADFYSGSGTTAAVAQALGRRWIACDQGDASIAILRKRLQGARFDIHTFDPIENNQRAAVSLEIADPELTTALEEYASLTLTDFVCLDGDDMLKGVEMKHWSDMVDGWMIGDGSQRGPMKPLWQSHRGHKKTLQLYCDSLPVLHRYKVWVITIFGKVVFEAFRSSNIDMVESC